MKYLVSFYCVLLSSLSLIGQTIYVDQGRIYSSCDEEIVMRGVNEMFVWSSDRTGVTTLPEIAKTGANSVRLVWTSEGDETEFDQLITNSLKYNMIPVVELHDATGDFSKLQTLLDYWKQPEILSMIDKHKKWLIVNIGNEVGGGSETTAEWVDYYKDAITQLRNAGIEAPLMIDCGGWGNNENYFLDGGNELLDFDPDHNIIFSVHTYWTNAGDQAKIDRMNNMITEAKQKKLPYIIGEGPQLAASPSSCTDLFPYKELMLRMEEEQIGWLAWSWGLVDNNDCGAPNSVFDITTDGVYGNWSTTFAEEICVTDVNSIQNTSIIPPSLISGSCSQVCDKPNLGSDQSICETRIINLNANLSEPLTTYVWYKDEVVLNETTTGIIVEEPGVYRVEASFNNCTKSDEVIIEGIEKLSLPAEAVLCDPITAELNLGLENSLYTYSWYKNDKKMNNESSNLLTVSEEGMYYAKTVFQECNEVSNSVNVTSNLPLVLHDTVCSAGLSILKVLSTGSFDWFETENSDIPIFSGSNYEVAITEDMTFYVTSADAVEYMLGRTTQAGEVWGIDPEDMGDADKKVKLNIEEEVRLESVVVYASVVNTQVTIRIRNSADTETIHEVTTLLSKANRNVIDLKKTLAAGDYLIDVIGTDRKLNYEAGNGEYPYTETGKVTIDANTSWANVWGGFFSEWVFTSASNCSAVPVYSVIDPLNSECRVTALEDDLKNTNTIQAFPNPASSKIVIRISGEEKAIVWELLDLSGQMILRDVSSEIDMTSLSNGLYVLYANGDSIKVIKK